MPEVGIRELLEAGVHFGHQTRRWNPKMRRFIHGERGGIYIIDLLQTQRLLEQARQFAGELAQRGGIVLFVGTKKQARDAVKDVAEAAGMPYVNHRWLGGLLTNFQTINQRIRRLHDLERYETEGQLGLLPTRERMAAEADLAKLRANLGGVKYMQRTPDAMFVIDLKTEAIAVREAQRLRIPIIGLVDTNCDPDGIDFVIPGNDDAIKSCAVVAHAIGEAARDGRLAFAAERAEEEERAAARPRSARAARPRSRPAATPRRRPPRRRRRRPPPRPRPLRLRRPQAPAGRRARRLRRGPGHRLPASPLRPPRLRPRRAPAPARRARRPPAAEPAPAAEAPAEPAPAAAAPLPRPRRARARRRAGSGRRGSGRARAEAPAEPAAEPRGRRARPSPPRPRPQPRNRTHELPLPRSAPRTSTPCASRPARA